MLRDHYAKLYNRGVFDWNDLRHFLAVARDGSTLAAARTSRVSQPTVVRRIAALEGALRIALFDRRPSGYLLTEAGTALLACAEQVESAAEAVAERAQSYAREVSGTVRISVFEIYAVTLLAPILRDFSRAHPHIAIELDVSDAIRDLSKGEANIALRSAIRLPGGGLTCRRIGTERWGFYCSRGYAETVEVPSSPDQLAGHPIIGEGQEDFWPEYAQWIREAQIRNSVAIHHGSATALLSAVRSGFGIALLPCLVADADPDLVRCFVGPDSGHSLWLVAHERERNVPKVRLVLNFLGERLIAAARAAGA